MDKTILSIFLLAMVLVWCTCLTYEDVKLRGQIISLQTDNATQAQRIRWLEERKCALPIDHKRIESNVNLIGGKVFVNWAMASKLYAARGAE